MSFPLKTPKHATPQGDTHKRALEVGLELLNMLGTNPGATITPARLALMTRFRELWTEVEHDEDAVTIVLSGILTQLRDDQIGHIVAETEDMVEYMKNGENVNG